jgi:hypothetical protein
MCGDNAMSDGVHARDKSFVNIQLIHFDLCGIFICICTCMLVEVFVIKTLLQRYILHT